MSKTITICSSAAFFRQCVEIEKELKKLGFKVKLPLTATLMQKQKDFDVSHYKTWWKKYADFKRKGYLMKNHFRKIAQSDAILVINYEKNGIKGYIGGNTLMEMGVAFYLRKPIYILNPIDEKNILKEEIYGMLPVFLDGELKNIIKYL